MVDALAAISDSVGDELLAVDEITADVGGKGPSGGVALPEAAFVDGDACGAGKVARRLAAAFDRTRCAAGNATVNGSR